MTYLLSAPGQEVSSLQLERRALEKGFSSLKRGKFGGDCTNYGCIPSKALIASAHVAHTLQTASDFGIETPPFSLNSSGVLKRVQNIVNKIRTAEEPPILKELGVETLEGTATFIDKRTLEVNGKKVCGKEIVIATGSSPIVPPIPGLDGTPFLTNETVFDLREIPKSILFIGGGPINCELAQTFSRLGADVTLVATHPTLLQREEREAQEVIQHSFEKEGITLLLGYQTESISYSGTFTAELRGKVPQTAQADALFIGVGRRPHLKDLQLEKIGILNADKGIPTDAYGRTQVKNVWAVGDAVGPPFFTHYAENQGRAVLRNLLLPFLLKKSRQPVPRCTFTSPEVASIGLKEEECTDKKIAVYTVPLKEIDRSITEGTTEGFVKIITKKWTSKILGATIVAPHAGEMLMELSTAMHAGLPLRKLASLMHPYPIESLAIRKAADKYLTETLLGAFRK